MALPRRRESAKQLEKAPREDYVLMLPRYRLPISPPQHHPLVHHCPREHLAERYQRNTKSEWIFVGRVFGGRWSEDFSKLFMYLAIETGSQLVLSPLQGPRVAVGSAVGSHVGTQDRHFHNYSISAKAASTVLHSSPLAPRVLPSTPLLSPRASPGTAQSFSRGSSGADNWRLCQPRGRTRVRFL